MKLVKIMFYGCFFFCTSKLLAQTTASLTLNSNTQGVKIARDQIKVVPPGGHVLYHQTNGIAHLYLDKSVQLPANYITTPPAIGNIRPLDYNLKPGTIKGSHQVDLSGAFNYNIPIQLPPGTNDMGPSLSISYNSNAGEGSMGLGWGISGISVITRVSKDLFHDGQKSAVEFNLTGPFALDGNRLTFQGANGNSENYFYTENETFSQVTMKNQNAQGQQYFEVKTKSGLTMIYGNTSDSKGIIPFSGRTLPSVGGITHWYLNKVIDNYGNYMEYFYYNSGSSTAGSDVVIKEIKYTGNANAAITPYNSVKFYYDLKANPGKEFYNGDYIDRKLLLREISVFSEITPLMPVFNYKFNYTHSDFDFLNEVIFSANGESLNSTVFVYGDPPITKTNLYATSPQLINAADYTAVDLNRDGLSDLVGFIYDGSDINTITGAKKYSGFTVFINNGLVGSTQAFTNTQTVLESFTFSNFVNTMLGLTHVKDGLLLADVAGDELPEIIYSKLTGTNLNEVLVKQFNPLTLQFDNFNYTSQPFQIRNADAAAGESSSFSLGDFDGDGKVELISYWIKNNGAFEFKYMDFNDTYSISKTDSDPVQLQVTDAQNNVYAMSQFQSFSAFDFDGDGKSDLVGILAGGAQTSFIKVNVGSSSLSLSEMYHTSFSLSHTMAGDYNGDGYLDFVSELMTSMKISYGTGVELTPSSTFINLSRHTDIKRISMDINGDGKSDIVELWYDSGNTGNIYINTILGSDLANSYVNIGTITGYKIPRNMDDELSATVDRDYDGDVDFFDEYSQNPNDIASYEVGDFNGDGNQDLLIKLKLQTAQVTGVIKIIDFNELSDEKNLTRVYDGNDNILEVNYFPLSNTSLISTNSTPGCVGAGYSASPPSPTYPLSNATRALKVVGYVSDLTEGGTKGFREAYYYTNAISHMNGRGFLGFDKIVKKSRRYGASSDVFQSTQEFGIDPVYFVRKPLQSKEEFISPGGNKVFSTTTYNTNVYGYATGSNLRYFHEMLSQSTVDNYINSTTTKTFSYDHATGNLLSETTNIGPGAEITQVTFSNFVNAGSWLNNAPLNESTTVTKSGESPFTRTRAFTYDASKGSILTLVREPSATKEVKTINVYDSNTGVLKQVTKKAPNDNSTPPPADIVVNYDYDPKSRFVEKTTYPLGYVTETKCGPVFGNPIFTKDVDGLVTKYKYDNYGSLTEAEHPDGTKTMYFQDWYNSSFSDPQDPKPVNGSSALFISRVEYPDGKKEITVSDRFGRPLKSEINSLNSTKFSNLMSYNDNGELEKEYGPYMIPLPNGKIVIEKTNTYAPDIGALVSHQVSDGTTNLVSSVSHVFNTTNKEVSITTTAPDGKIKTEITDQTGRLIKVTDNNGGVLTYEYKYDGANFINITKLNGITILTKKSDNFNHITEETEPNSGTRLYTVNSFGQLKGLVDNKNTSYAYTYDLAGRLETEAIGPDYYNYSYINSGVGKGQLAEININNGNAYKYSYDGLSRLKQIEEYLDGKSYLTRYDYDQLGRVSKETYPNGFGIINEYVNGDLVSIKNARNNYPIWQLDELDNSGKISKYTLGNSVQTINSFDNFGFPTGTQSGNVQHLSYDYNIQNSNLNAVTDNITGNIESYAYDNLDRLNAINSIQYGGDVYTTFDGNGNINSKFDAGTYTYHGTRYNQVISTPNPYANISPQQQDVNYNLFDKATYILEGNNSVDISYGSDMQRYKTVFKTNSTVTNTRYYLNGMERNVSPSDVITDLNYVHSPTGLCAIEVKEGNAAPSLNYVYNDFVASIVAITDGNGAVTARQNFDAWGRRRDPLTRSYTNIGSVPTWLTRGYTGHEQLPQFTLINMNGRIYDPVLARFLSVDPVLSDYTNSQDYNKYSYVRNNPLKYTDPSGNSAVMSAIFSTGLGIGLYAGAAVSVGAIAFGGIRAASNPYGSRPLVDAVSSESTSEMHARQARAQRAPMSGVSATQTRDWTEDFVYSYGKRDVWVDAKLRSKFGNDKTKYEKGGPMYGQKEEPSPGYWTTEMSINTYYFPGGSGGQDPPSRISATNTFNSGIQNTNSYGNSSNGIALGLGIGLTVNTGFGIGATATQVFGMTSIAAMPLVMYGDEPKYKKELSENIYYHYTNSANLGGIIARQTIYPSGGGLGKVYLTRAEMAPIDVFQRLFNNQETHRGKENFYVAFRIRKMDEAALQFHKSTPYELWHLGPLHLKQIVHFGPNLFKTK